MNISDLQHLEDLENQYDDDPVLIAVKAFHGSKPQQCLWRKYFVAMQILSKSVEQAIDDFMELIYIIQSEIKNDCVPNKIHTKRGDILENYHAFMFQDRLKKMFLARHGYVDFNKILPTNYPHKEIKK